MYFLKACSPNIRNKLGEGLKLQGLVKFIEFVSIDADGDIVVSQITDG